MRFEYVFDDGGMNLLSSGALAAIRDFVAQLTVDSSQLTEATGQPSTVNRQPIFVFRSGRPNLFAAGADMAEMQRFTAGDADAFARLGQETFADIERLPLVTVCLIDGDCFGGALDLAMAFDLRFATPRTRLAHPGAKLGIVTGFGGTSRWRRLVDAPAARRLFLANDVLSAGEAQSLGLVDLVGDSFEDELTRLESLDPMQTRFVKELSRHADALSPDNIALLAERLGALYLG